MQKIINPGTVALSGYAKPINAPVFCKMEYKDGRLSISGVIGPLASGNARGGCGQIDSTLKEHLEAGEYKPAAVWSVDLFAQFLEAWDRWHLNDMKPHCEHQAHYGWAEKAREEIKIYHWILKPEVYKKKTALEAEALARARSVEARSTGFYAQDRAIMRLELHKATDAPELTPADARYYTEDIEIRTGKHYIETKTRGWVRFSDDSRGLLGKACPDCAYEYGSAWKTEPVPEAVIQFLSALPETTKTPAWV